MDAEQEKQEQIIRFLVTNLATCRCEQFVFDQFVRELEEKKEVAILELLRNLRDSPRVGAVYASAGNHIDAIVLAALGTTPLVQVEKLIKSIWPENGRPRSG